MELSEQFSCLQFDTVESSEYLPDTLDIGDVSEYGSSSKLKNVVGEASASSSGPADPAPASWLNVWEKNPVCFLGHFATFSFLQVVDKEYVVRNLSNRDGRQQWSYISLATVV